MLSKQEAREMARDLPTVSYCATQSNTAVALNYEDYLGRSLASTQHQLLGALGAQANTLSALYQPTTNTPTPQKIEVIVARLIRYTVTDPNSTLAEKMPEKSILTSGTVMLNGQDDRGFLMELAPKLADLLIGHNEIRSSVEYEDKEGKNKTLKPIKISNLDVVIEVLKEYKS